MTYTYIQAPDFVKRNPATGVVESIQCKVCGVVIADTQEFVNGIELDKDGNRIKIVQRQLIYYPNYCQIKIEMDNNSAHVTNGCKDCLKIGMSPQVLTELYKADLAESPEGYPASEKPIHALRVVVFKEGQEGIP